MLSPISVATPLVEMKKTRRRVDSEPLAFSTTLPGTSASIVTARSMQSAASSFQPQLMLLLNSYVPACTRIVLMALSPMAATRSSVEETRNVPDGRVGRVGGDGAGGGGEGTGGGGEGVGGGGEGSGGDVGGVEGGALNSMIVPEFLYAPSKLAQVAPTSVNVP
jgi:hypothetical protein